MNKTSHNSCCSWSFLFVLFPFCKPSLEIGLHFWLCKIFTNVIKYTTGESINGILRNARIINQLLLSSHNAPLKINISI